MTRGPWCRSASTALCSAACHSPFSACARAVSDHGESARSGFPRFCKWANLLEQPIRGERMPGAYSADLRERVVGSVNAGTSCRGARAVFKVSVSTAIPWAHPFHQTRDCQAKPTGGDRRSRAIEAHTDWLLALAAKEPARPQIENPARFATHKPFA